MQITEIRDEQGALTALRDENGNIATIAFWGNEDAARKSLATLVDCKNCTNCSHCSDCSHCSGCSGCSHCSGCSGCSYCLDCSDCSDCLDCSDCSDCLRCSDCSHCWDCSHCSDCLDCSDCSDCSGCSGCNDEAGKTSDHAQPPVPVIQRIHSAVYAAASAPDALNMGYWHTCDTTHCRAGWVVALAGDEGKALEDYWGTPHAAWLIYRASDPAIKAYPDFYTTNERALADMKRLADAEAA